MDLEKIFEDNYNASSLIHHGRTTEDMPTMNKEKFIEVVSELLKINSNCINCGKSESSHSREHKVCPDRYSHYEKK